MPKIDLHLNITIPDGTFIKVQSSERWEVCMENSANTRTDSALAALVRATQTPPQTTAYRSRQPFTPAHPAIPRSPPKRAPQRTSGMYSQEELDDVAHRAMRFLRGRGPVVSRELFIGARFRGSRERNMWNICVAPKLIAEGVVTRGYSQGRFDSHAIVWTAVGDHHIRATAPAPDGPVSRVGSLYVTETSERQRKPNKPPRIKAHEAEALRLRVLEALREGPAKLQTIIKRMGSLTKTEEHYIGFRLLQACAEDGSVRRQRVPVQRDGNGQPTLPYSIWSLAERTPDARAEGGHGEQQVSTGYVRGFGSFSDQTRVVSTNPQNPDHQPV